jgi:murein DD-endopeptidase MepM/ murein hydrolase activator NlpD
VELRNSLRLGALLVVLTGINVYVFFFRDDTSVKKLMSPTSTGKVLSEEHKRVLAESATPVSAPAAKPGAPAPVAALPGAAKPGAPAAAPAPGEPNVEGKTVEGTVGAHDTLGEVLSREGLGAVSGAVVKALGRLIDPKSIRPGDRYAVNLDAEGTPESFEYMPSPVVRYIVAPKADGTSAWDGRKEEKPLTVRTVEAGGSIESSLYESIHKAGESAALVALLVDIFAWDINFYIDTHPGDHWRVVVEKQFLGDKFYKYGAVLAAEYGGRIGTYRAFAYNPGGGRGPTRYYDERGQAIAKSFLKSPLRFVRVSSKFDLKRFHPILHRQKAHLGVDYAAPQGTPVWASAGGRIADFGNKGGSGNTVIISHGNGLVTMYFHLSRFAAGLKVGRQVHQKELIGYVGMTGLATGPHLHFSVLKNGSYVDPMKLQSVREPSVADRAAYLATIKPRLAALKGPPPTVAGNEPAPASAPVQ